MSVFWRRHGVTVLLTAAIASTFLATIFVNMSSQIHLFYEEVVKAEERQNVLAGTIKNMTGDISALLTDIREARARHDTDSKISSKVIEEVEKYEGEEAEGVKERAKKKLQSIQEYVDSSKKAILKMMKKGKDTDS